MENASAKWVEFLPFGSTYLALGKAKLKLELLLQIFLGQDQGN